MKNIEIQEKLDEQKYCESELNKQDMSGKMFYCDYCSFKTTDKACNIPHQERVANSVCAKAYNRGMKKNER